MNIEEIQRMEAELDRLRAARTMPGGDALMDRAGVELAKLRRMAGLPPRLAQEARRASVFAGPGLARAVLISEDEL